jgi:hypothetical protein
MDKRPNYRPGADAGWRVLFASLRPRPRAAQAGRSATSHTMRIYLVLGALVALAGCSRAPVVTITNYSSITLSNVVVSGSGFSERIGTVEAGGQHKLTVHPRGESGMRVAFDAGSQHVDSGDQGYFEASGGYRVSATVGTNLSVSVSSDLRAY